MQTDAALAYASKHEPHALLVQTGSDLRLEFYAAGYSASKPHPLYSGAKSFWGIAALEAQREGLISLDEPVTSRLPEFAGDARRSITPRMLLQMTAGYGFGGLGNAVPTYDRVLDIQLKNPPAATFTYGGIPLQVFGAYFSRALASLGLTPHTFLRERVLEKAGVEIATWRELSDGTHPLPTGAQLTARAWLNYGRYVLGRREDFAEAFRAAAQNERYGLGWWLAPAGTPADCFYASGAAGQGLYVIPSADTVVVRFGKSTSYKHDVFLKRLLAAAATN